MTDPAQSVIFVRHGTADYDARTAFGDVFEGARRDLAPLSAKGIAEIESIIEVLRPLRPTTVLSSPYTRTMHTAAILAAGLAIPLRVELGLHDWLPVRSGLNPVTEQLVRDKGAEYAVWRATGVLEDGRTWETDAEMRDRLLAVIAKYNASRLIAVSHEAPIMAVTGETVVPPGSWHEWHNSVIPEKG